MQLLIINGPNLNFLGIREKQIYGNQDYEALKKLIEEKAAKEGDTVEFFQSNHEGAIIDRIQEAYADGTEGIVINPGAFTHYSYALHDALASYHTFPKIEVHISDIQNREEWRKISVTAPACDGQIFGKGFPGYLEAMDLIKSLVKEQ
ncbi:MAG: type II 3-dehydroquinate dehydratase [Lachnospiraceae bacterium]|nr:type II 3-dehydroquinate dehydratase [Lachnospiraceae bacterium]